MSRRKTPAEVMAGHCDLCMRDIPKVRKGQRFCSDSCRAAHWRVVHEPRCYNCGVPLHITTGPARPIRHHVRRSNAAEGV